MTAREKRVIKAFALCVEKGEYTPEYAILLIEDNARYGWLSMGAKDAFYAWLDAWEAEKEEPEPEPEPEPDPEPEPEPDPEPEPEPEPDPEPKEDEGE